MQIIISGGGTGGHIYPALAIAQALRAYDRKCDILFVGANGKMEMFKVPAAGYPIAGLWIDGLKRGSFFKNILLPFKVVSSLWKARQIIQYFRPHVVIGTGGYASGPILYMAARAGIPTLIQEQNAYPGITNKLLSKYVNRICVAFPHMDTYFPPEKIVLTGNPVNPLVLSSPNDRAEARAYFGLDPDRKCLLVLGGSLGARTLNEAVQEGLPLLAEAGIQVLWQTGAAHLASVQTQLTGEVASWVKHYPFIDRMDLAYAAADVVIARGGALTLSELSVTQKPAIIVPSPNVASDHQTKNVLSLIQKGAVWSVKDDEAKQTLISTALQLLQDEAQQEALVAQISAMAHPKATQDIITQIMQLVDTSTAVHTITALRQYRNVYFLGIGGIGMSALARWCQTQHLQVFGYDRTPTPLTDQLILEDMPVIFKDSVDAIPALIKNDPQHTLVVYTPAVPSKHPQLEYFRHNGFKLYKRAEVLGLLTEGNFTIGVAGTHGKTTTAAMLAHILYKAGKDMIALVGGIMQDYHTNLLIKGERPAVIVVEADEFDRSFLHLHPTWGVVTAVEPDHLDIYKNERAVEEAFQAFVKLLPSDGRLFVHQVALDKVVPADPAVVVTPYSKENAEVRAENLVIQSPHFVFDYVSPTHILKGIKLGIPGYHNVENALAAISVCLQMGIEERVIRYALENFKGVQRRFEYVLQDPRMVMIDDYAHHPTEVAAFLNSVKALYPDKKVTAIFQPHLFSRTRDFAQGFGESLSLAHEVLLMPIYPAREEPMPGVTSQLIFEHITASQKGIYDKGPLLEYLQRAKTLEVVVTIGAGDIAMLVDPIRAILEERLVPA